MKRIYTLFILALLLPLGLQAQNLAVQSFRMDETDLTANTAGTTVIDQNGNKCALIKVITTQTGFSFDCGSLGIVKTEQHVGEVWIYVPEGVKRLTISHPLLGQVRDYDLGQTLKRARTYVLHLTTGEVQTTVKQARTSQFVLFQLSPTNAVVTLNGEMLTTQDGTATKMMRFGTYDYQVQAPKYLPEVGKVTVNDPKNKHIVNVQLKPNFRRVTLTVDNNAEIWVNGDRMGQGSWSGDFGAGTYELETRLANHRPVTVTRDIAASTEPQTIRLQAPLPIYGEVEINSSPAMADIFIDGQKRGQTPQLIDQLLVGQHEVRLSKQGYQDYSGTMTIREGETTSVSATLKKIEIAQVQSIPSAPATPNTQPALAIPTAPSPAVTPGQGRTFTVGGVSFTMILVEGQGAPYYIGETEVTQALWQAVMGSNPSMFKGNQLPVDQVSWKDCKKFVGKLNIVTGKRFRLPTETEWIYAAKGGNRSRGYKYSGSNNIDDVAWYKDNSGNVTHRVKTKLPNELGIYDMTGNVEEWCEDKFDSKSNSRVKKGGDLFSDKILCDIPGTHMGTPLTFKNMNRGFRLALSE